MSDATWDDAQLGRGHINGGVAVGIANRWSRRKCTYDGDVSTYTGVKLAKIQQACSEKRNGRGFGGEEMGPWYKFRGLGKGCAHDGEMIWSKQMIEQWRSRM